MNIYDEVKVITHEEARKIVKSNHNKFYTEGTFTNDIQNYIAQCEAKEQRAKKVEVADSNRQSNIGQCCLCRRLCKRSVRRLIDLDLLVGNSCCVYQLAITPMED